MERRIICAGSARSGSTWQYNAVRFLFDAAGQTCYGAWIKDYDPSRQETIHVLKTHNPTFATGPGTVLTAYRDLRDVVASQVRMGWFTGMEIGVLDRFLERYIINLAVWRTEARHVMRYETMKNDSTAELVHLSRSLDLSLGTEAINGVRCRIDELRPAKSTPAGSRSDYDPETQLHAGHISGSAFALSAEWRLHIEKRYSRWLRRHGYEVRQPVWSIDHLGQAWQLTRRTWAMRRQRNSAAVSSE